MHGFESWRRAVVKSVVWRVIGVVILGGVSYAFTGSFSESLGITSVFTAIRVVLYVVHERVWDRIGWGRLPCPQCGYVGPWLATRTGPAGNPPRGAL